MDGINEQTTQAVLISFVEQELCFKVDFKITAC